MLQYANDINFCLKHDIAGANNLKLVLYLYVLMYGLIINFHISEIITQNNESSWGEIFGCACES